jgi:two-component system sensor histidine kinase and response regulator WspE
MDNRPDPSEFTILSLFQLEVKTQTAVFHDGFLALAAQPQSSSALESLTNAIYKVKGVAAIAEIDVAFNLANIIEDSFITVQNLSINLSLAQINVLRQGADLLLKISQIAEKDVALWLSEHQPEIDITIEGIATLFTGMERQDPQPIINPPIVSPIIPIPEVPVSFSVDAQPLTSLPSPVIPIDDEEVNITDTSMLELFRLEVEGQGNVLNEGLLSLESQPQSSKVLESLMRAAHSIKGAARIVSIEGAVNLAHVMEDCFVAAQSHAISLDADSIDALLKGVDLLLKISQLEPSELNPWLSEHRSQIAETREEIACLLTGEKKEPKKETTIGKEISSAQVQSEAIANIPESTSTSIVNPISREINSFESEGQKITQQPISTNDRIVRVNADNLNRIMGLAGESLIEANWLQPFADSLIVLKKQQLQLSKILQEFQEAVAIGNYQDSQQYLEAARAKELECREVLGDRLSSLELFARRTASLSDRLYREVIASNMRPFTDGVQGFPRMIRDLARKLGKQVKFDIIGKSTPVDRDILKKLEAPLTHILRNAIDHGIELPEERLAAGKFAEGTMRLEAAHRGGMLSITISDDGRGINLDWLRQKIVAKNLAPVEMVEQLTESELMEFLFLPGFSTASQVTEISGRGVGLDIAKSMAQEVGGNVRAFSVVNKGITFNFQLPLTLSVVRTLLVEISGELYAFPLARIEQIVMVEQKEISSIENRQYFTMDNKNIGLVSAHQVLELPEPKLKSDVLSVVVIGEQSDYYGLVVDRFLGGHDLVVRPLDPRLGKVQDISAAALMGDGSPILIVDISDLIRSVDNLLNSNQLNRFGNQIGKALKDSRKSILVVDDSITVREMERKLLENKGYKVDVAVDGMEGWHTVSSKNYDLVISDIDMPRMNGIELVTKIKNHPKLSSIPVIIISYKDREEDRLSGLEAGADYYLTKASFHDDTLVNAVLDLIGN